MASQAAALRSFIDNSLPRYATDAEPTDLTPEQLHALGFRRQDIIQFHLKCYTNRNYVAFHKAYVMSWWQLLGLPLNKIRIASAIHYPGDAKDLLLTYVLRDPIYLPLINRTPNFVFAYPGGFYCPHGMPEYGGWMECDLPPGGCEELPCPVYLDYHEFEVTIKGERNDDFFFQIPWERQNVRL